MKNKKSMNSQNISKSAFAGITLFALLLFGLGTNACSTNVEDNSNLAKNTNSSGTETTISTPKPEAEKTETPENKSTKEEAKKEDEKKEEPKTEDKTDEKKDDKDDKKVDDGVSKLKKEMSYADARKTLIAAGWKPVKNNDVGEYGNERRMIDEFKYIEVDACSGTGMGFCLFVFKNADGKTLSVTTVNNEEGQKGGPLVYGWEVSK